MEHGTRTTRRQFLASSAVAGVAVAGGFDLAFGQDAPDLPPPPLKPATAKPPHRFSLDPFEVQKKGPIVYNYGTRVQGLDKWYGLQGHNFGGCRDYPPPKAPPPPPGTPTVTRADVRARWEEKKVVPVYMVGADPKAGVEKVRKDWEEAVTQKYPVISIDEFYAAPRTPVEYDGALAEFKKQHPEIFVQVWEATVPAKFPHLEIFMPFIDAYMPEVYWKWFKDDGERRKIFRDLIDRAKKMGALKKLLMGLGTHDVDHMKKTLEDIPAIMDMEPGIGGFAFFVHRGDIEDAEYHKLYDKMDELLRGLFAE